MTAIGPVGVMLVTSRRRLSPEARTPREAFAALDLQIDEAIDAGVDVIQIREGDADAAALAACAARAVRRAAGTGVAILVNDRADVAAAAGAAGVHLPSRGLPASRVRTLEPSWLIGRSMHAGDDRALAEGTDYWLFGAVFDTVSKPGAVSAGLSGLRDIAAGAAVPILAIGGVTPRNARACLDAGAAGVAAIGAFLPPGRARDALGVAAATRAFREAFVRIC